MVIGNWNEIHSFRLTERLVKLRNKGNAHDMQNNQLWNSWIRMPFRRLTPGRQHTRKMLVRFFAIPSKERNPKRSHQKNQNVVCWPASLPPVKEVTPNDQIQKMTCSASCYSTLRCVPFWWKETERLLITTFFSSQTALDLGNRHFPLSRAALIVVGVLTWCVGLLDQHLSAK